MSRPKSRFCLRGHDTLIVGRNCNARCNQCVLDYKNEYYRTNKHLHTRYKRAWRRHKAIAEAKAKLNIIFQNQLDALRDFPRDHRHYTVPDSWSLKP